MGADRRGKSRGVRYVILIKTSGKSEIEQIMTLRQVSASLTIGVRARDFYHVIVDEGQARINFHVIENK